MDKRILTVAVMAVAAVACLYAAQDTAIEKVEVRDPVRLEAFLEANASDAETRIAAVEAGIQTSTTAVGAMAVATNLTVGGTAAVTGILTADEHDAKTATALLLGKATATAVTVGASDAHTTVAGNLIVTGTTTANGTTTLGNATNDACTIAGNVITLSGTLKSSTNGCAHGELWLNSNVLTRFP